MTTGAAATTTATMAVVVASCEPSCPPELQCILLLASDSQNQGRCASASLQSLQQQLSVLLAEPASENLTAFTESLASAAGNVMRPEDIPVLIDLFVQSLAAPMAGLELSAYQSLVSTGSRLLDSNQHSTWLQLNQSDVTRQVSKLIAGLELLGHQLFLQTNNTSGQIIISEENVGVAVIRPGCNSIRNDELVSVNSSILMGNDVADTSISLPATVFGLAMANCADTGVVVVVYDGIGPLLSGDDLMLPCTPPTEILVHGRCPWSPPPTDACSNRTVDGSVLTASVISATNTSAGGGVMTLNTSNLLRPVRIAFQHQVLVGSNPSCAFLNEQNLRLANETWLAEGCRVVSEESSQMHTVCECYHLTSFALLISPTGSMTENQPIQIISKIGLCISIICLLITIILLFTLKLDSKQMHAIHRQLAIALCVAQTLFLIGVDRTLVPSPDALCTTIAVLLHYFFLCTFAWQLVEGIHLYIFIVKVFYNKKLVWLYYPLGWGVPAVVVAITLGVRFCNYGSEHYCWITDGDGTNWAFHGPVIAVLVVNIVIMVIVSSVIFRAARKKENPDTCLVCTLLHASLVLVPILGISWALGFFVVGEGTISTVIEWLFCIFTSLQGLMIFLMHCVVNREVRKAFLNAIGCREAAKRQETVHNMRRSSMAYLRRRGSSDPGVAISDRELQRLRKKFNMFPKRAKGAVWEGMDSESESVLSSFSRGRPSLTTDHISPSVTLPGIAEEEDGYSLPSSMPSTPERERQQNSYEIERDIDRLTEP